MPSDRPQHAERTRSLTRWLSWRGRRLALLRTAWIAIALLSLGLVAGGLPYRYSILRIICRQEPCAEQQLTASIAPTYQADGISLTFYAAYTTTIELIFVLVWFAIGTLIFWRRSNDRMAVLVACMLVTSGATFTGFSRALALSQPVWLVPNLLLELVSGGVFVLFCYLFPDGRFIPRWARWFAPVSIVSFSLSGGLISQMLERVPILGQLRVGLDVVSLATVLFLLFVQVYRYRKVSDAVARHQTKWVVFGLVTAIVGFMLLILLSFVVPPEQVDARIALALNGLTNGIMVLIPVSIGIAIVRYRLYDIDVIINRTLVYSVLTLALALVYIGGVVLMQQLIRPLTGSTELAIVAATLGVAALFAPLRRRIQNTIDKRFYRRKYDAAKVLAAFGATVRDETDLERLTTELLRVVDETMQPELVGLWLPAEPIKTLREPDGSPPNATQPQ